jgi:hypothetical protein
MFPHFGHIFRDPNFLFPDGTTRPKLLIILALSRSSDYIVVRTTSKQKGKSATYGCHNDELFDPSFTIPATLHIQGLTLDTWVCLDWVFELEKNKVDNLLANNAIDLTGEVPIKTMRDLLACAANADDTEQHHVKSLLDLRSRLP